jgi:hypothetical protein
LSGAEATLTNLGLISNAGGSGPITLAADNMALSSGTVFGGTGRVTLRSVNTGNLIDLGSSVDTNANTLELSSGELSTVGAATLVVGDATAGEITISAAIAPAGTGTLHLVSGQGISSATGTDRIMETSLALDAGDRIDVDTLVSGLAAKTSAGGIVVRNTGDLEITTVNGLSGVESTGGSIDIEAASSLTVSDPVSATGSDEIELAATESIQVDATVQSESGAIRVLADDDVSFGATGQIGSTAGSVTVTADADVNANGAGGALTMADAAVIDAGSGPIDLSADEDITLGRLVTTNDTASAVAITSTSGGVVDGGDTGGEDIEATAANALVRIEAVTGVGSTGAIDTEIGTLDLRNSSFGNVDLNETDALSINRLGQGALFGTVNVDAGDTLTVVAGQPGVSAVAGQLELDGASSIEIDGTVQTASGPIRVLADDDVSFGTAGQIRSTAGSVTVTADADGNANGAGGALTMADGAVIDAGSGPIDLNADEDITLGRLVTADDAASAVTITSTSGGVVDVGDMGGADIEATTVNAVVRIEAVTGVGSGDAIETQIRTLDLENTGSGNVGINETDALSINRIVQGAPNGTVNVNAGDTLMLVAGQAGVSAVGGQVELAAGQDVLLNAAVSTSGGGVTVTADADGNANGVGGALTIPDGVVIDAGSGPIALNADQDITLGRLVTTNDTASAVAITSTSGEIVDGGDTGGADIEATAANAVVTMEAVTGVGSGGAIDTEIRTLDLANTGSGSVEIDETDTLSIQRIDQDAPNGRVAIAAGDTIEVTDVAAVSNVELSTTVGDITIGDIVSTDGFIVLEPSLGSGNVVIPAGTGRLSAGAWIGVDGDVEGPGGLEISAGGAPTLPFLSNMAVGFTGNVGGVTPLAALSIQAAQGTVAFLDSGPTTVRTEGNLELNPIERSSPSDVATIYKRDGNLDLQSNSGNVTLGKGERLTVAFGDLDIQGGTLTVGDLTADKIDLTAGRVVVQLREAGPVRVPGGARINDKGTDLVANQITFNGSPTIELRGQGTLTFGTPTNTEIVPPLGDLGFISGPGQEIALRTLKESGDKLVASDLIDRWDILDGIPRGLGAPFDPSPIPVVVIPEPPEPPDLGPAPPKADEVLAWLQCAQLTEDEEVPEECLPEVAATPGEAAETPEFDRPEFEAEDAVNALELYRGLLRNPQSVEEMRSVFGQAFGGYRLQTGAARIEGGPFRQYLEGQPEHEQAASYLDQIAFLLAGLEGMQLLPGEFLTLKEALLAEMIEILELRGISPSELGEAIEASVPSRGRPAAWLLELLVMNGPLLELQ